MAKGQHLSRYQQGIVRRFYEHRDSVLIQRLQEAVSDLAMDPGSEKVWEKAERALRALTLDPPLAEDEIAGTVGARDVGRLARVVENLCGRR